jgi:serine O-acetyltransferase
MALVRNPEQDAPETPAQPGDQKITPLLLRSVESGSPPTPRERNQRFRWPGAIDVVFEKDPAARNIFEVLMYQGLHAIALHRVAHALYRARIPIVPRFISQFGRLWTGGIEIHPGAKIGKRFFIDHGSGVVIGETAEIGDNVMLYHQVTLGATGWWKNLGPNRRIKRHPTIEDNVTIGCGASILGPVTIGRNSKIGAMALVLEDVPPDSVVVAKPAELLMLRGKELPQHQDLSQGWEPEYHI